MTAVAFCGRYHTLVAECTDRTMVLKDCCVVHNLLPRALYVRAGTEVLPVDADASVVVTSVTPRTEVPALAIALFEHGFVNDTATVEFVVNPRARPKVVLVEWNKTEITVRPTTRCFHFLTNMLDVPLFWLWRYDDLVTAVEVPPRATHPSASRTRPPSPPSTSAAPEQCPGDLHGV